MCPVIDILSFRFGSFIIMMCVAAVAGFFVMLCRIDASGLNINRVLMCLAVMLPFIFIGGKTVYALTMVNEIVRHKLTLASIVSQGGFVFYGGFLGGLLGIRVYVLLSKELFYSYSDFLIPLIPLVQGFGRIGCFLNGCCYGILYNGILSVEYPISGRLTSGLRLFPVQILESLVCFIIAVILLSWSTQTKAKKTWTYFVLYSFARFFIEFLRGDQIRGIWFHLSVSQWISIVLFPIGLINLIIINRSVNKNIQVKKINTEELTV